MPVSRHVPMYRVWDPSNQDEADAEGRWEYGALDVANAAMYHARRRWGPDEFASRYWPLTFHVRELDTGKLFAVSVDLDWEPRFTPATPEEIL